MGAILSVSYYYFGFLSGSTLLNESDTRGSQASYTRIRLHALAKFRRKKRCWEGGERKVIVSASTVSWLSPLFWQLKWGGSRIQCGCQRPFFFNISLFLPKALYFPCAKLSLSFSLLFPPFLPFPYLYRILGWASTTAERIHRRDSHCFELDGWRKRKKNLQGCRLHTYRHRTKKHRQVRLDKIHHIWITKSFLILNSWLHDKLLFLEQYRLSSKPPLVVDREEERKES